MDVQEDSRDITSKHDVIFYVMYLPLIKLSATGGNFSVCNVTFNTYQILLYKVIHKIYFVDHLDALKLGVLRVRVINVNFVHKKRNFWVLAIFLN